MVLDSNVQVVDVELSTIDNFSGATLTLVRHGGANAQRPVLGQWHAVGAYRGRQPRGGGVTVGSVTTNSGGTLVLSFNASATNARVNAVMQQIALRQQQPGPADSA